MAERKNPIKIELINKDEYRISISIENWQLSKLVSQNALKELQEHINEVTGLSKIAEVFQCSNEESRKINNFWEMMINRNTCNKCDFKLKECYNCVIKCESPLERELHLELCRQNFRPVLQRRINKDGSFYDFPENIDAKNILTLPDFYIEEGEIKLCIYADGHTYHERTEYQAQRDRNIDRELQRLGFKVLRFTGSEIRKDKSLVIKSIKSNLKENIFRS